MRPDLRNDAAKDFDVLPVEMGIRQGSPRNLLADLVRAVMPTPDLNDLGEMVERKISERVVDCCVGFGSSGIEGKYRALCRRNVKDKEALLDSTRGRDPRLNGPIGNLGWKVGGDWFIADHFKGAVLSVRDFLTAYETDKIPGCVGWPLGHWLFAEGWEGSLATVTCSALNPALRIASEERSQLHVEPSGSVPWQ